MIGKPGVISTFENGIFQLRIKILVVFFANFHSQSPTQLKILIDTFNGYRHRNVCFIIMKFMEIFLMDAIYLKEIFLEYKYYYSISYIFASYIILHTVLFATGIN